MLCPTRRTLVPKQQRAGSRIAVRVTILHPSCRLLPDKMIAHARRRAGDFIHKQNPSGYEEPAMLPNETAAGQTPHPLPRSTADTPATLYGSWWHTLFEHFPWKAEPSQWQAAFDALQSSSPDPDRSAREWQQLRDDVARFRGCAIPRRPGTIVHTEFPFLWRMDEQSCLEGVIDLLAVDPAREALPAARLEDESPND